MPISLERPILDRSDRSRTPFSSTSNPPAHHRSRESSLESVNPDRLQPLLPPSPCPHNRRRSDHRQAAPEPTSAPLHFVWNTVKQTVSHVLGNV